MVKIEKIKVDGENLFIKYITFDSDNETTEEHNVKSNRSPEKGFYDAWNAVQSKLPGILAYDGERCSVALRQVTFKRKNSFADQLDYKVQFHGYNNVDESVEQLFKTQLKKCYKDETAEGETIVELPLDEKTKRWKDATEAVDHLIEKTIQHLQGASTVPAQQNLFTGQSSPVVGVEEY